MNGVIQMPLEIEGRKKGRNVTDAQDLQINCKDTQAQMHHTQMHLSHTLKSNFSLRKLLLRVSERYRTEVMITLENKLKNENRKQVCKVLWSANGQTALKFDYSWTLYIII